MKKYFSSYWIRSAFYTFLQRFSLTFFGLVNFVILIRSLSQPQMGTWALFLSVTAIFEATKSNLLKNAHIKYVSGSDGSEKTVIASSSLIINIIINLVFILFIIFFGNMLSHWFHSGRDLAIMLRWFIPGMVFMVFFSHFEAVQQSHLDFKGVFAGYFVRQALFFSIVVSYYFLKRPFSLADLAIYQSVSVLVGTIVLYFYSRKYLLYRFDPTVLWIKKIIGYGGYIFGSGMMANIFANLDQLMTATFMSTRSVAYYNAASRINGFVDIPSFAAAEIIFPKLSRASAEEGNSRVKYLYERMSAILISFTIPAALFIIFFPHFVIGLIAGNQYQAASLILQLYMIIGILRPMQNQAANLLNSIGKPRLCFVINTISLAVYLLINYICLSALGFYGAAIGTLITSLLGMLAWYIIMKKQIGFELVNILKYVAETYKMIYTVLAGLLSRTKQVQV